MDGDVYEEGVEPLAKWNLTPGQALFYKFALKHENVPNQSFGTRDEMLNFVKKYAPLFKPYADFFMTNPNIAGTTTIPEHLAKGIDALKEGHSIERHGPAVGPGELEGRLTTGSLNGTFAPADKGYATGFTDYDSYLYSQRNALNYIQGCYVRTVHILQPLLTTLKTKIEQLNGLAGAAIGAKKKEILLARNALGKAFTDNSLANPDNTPADLFPLDLDVALFNNVQKLSAAEKDLVDGLVKYKDKYKIVIDHGAAVGRGKKVKATEMNSPDKQVMNPKWKDGKLSPVWRVDQIEDMAPITKTTTTLNPPGDKTFKFDANLLTWSMPQHFPDNGAVGWRSA